MDGLQLPLRIRLAGLSAQDQLRVACEVFDRLIEDNLRAFTTKAMSVPGFDADTFDEAIADIRRDQQVARAEMIAMLKRELGLP